MSLRLGPGSQEEAVNLDSIFVTALTGFHRNEMRVWKPCANVLLKPDLMAVALSNSDL